ncbi:MAG: hypothetical protein ACRELU_08300 [Gemmatimonadota bacterium]
MPRSRLASALIGATFPAALLIPAPAPAQEPGGVDAKIASALSAGPPEVTAAATVVDWPSEGEGEMTELRAGSNGWTCLPDIPGSPADDPMCLDSTFFAWMGALQAGIPPAIGRVGFAYMLQGGSTPSNTDPFASEPAPGGDWLIEPPHVMMVVPDPGTLQGLTTDPANGGPWIMWADTPYAHVMMPVDEAAHDRRGDHEHEVPPE